MRGGVLIAGLMENSAIKTPPRIFNPADRKSTRLNSSHLVISYAVFCLKKKISPQPVGDHRDAVADGEPLDEHLVWDLDLALLQRARHHLDQPVDRDLRGLEISGCLRHQ